MHSAENVKGGTLLDLLTFILLQNIKKFEGGPLGNLKNFRKKVAQNPLGTSRFVGFLEKVKNERGTF